MLWEAWEQPVVFSCVFPPHSRPGAELIQQNSIWEICNSFMLLKIPSKKPAADFRGLCMISSRSKLSVFWKVSKQRDEIIFFDKLRYFKFVMLAKEYGNKCLMNIPLRSNTFRYVKQAKAQFCTSSITLKIRIKLWSLADLKFANNFSGKTLILLWLKSSCSKSNMSVWMKLFEIWVKLLCDKFINLTSINPLRSSGGKRVSSLSDKDNKVTYCGIIKSMLLISLPLHAKLNPKQVHRWGQINASTHMISSSSYWKEQSTAPSQMYTGCKQVDWPLQWKYPGQTTAEQLAASSSPNGQSHLQM